MCILHNGVPTEELKNGVVILPFGTEYKIRFRNKHNRRAIVQFWIDGEPMHEDNPYGGYVVPANGYVDIERPFDVQRKFKFVDLDSPDAIDHGKNGPNHDKQKGLIEARFYLEKEYKAPETIYVPYPVPTYPRPRPYDGIWCETKTRGMLRSKGISGQSSGFLGEVDGGISYSAQNSVQPAMFAGACLNLCDSLNADVDVSVSSGSSGMIKDGATVEGGYSSQRFSSVSVDVDWDNYITLKLFLQGRTQATQAKVEIKGDISKLNSEDLGQIIKEKVKAAQESDLERQLREAKEDQLRLELALIAEKKKKLEKELKELKK